MPLPTRRPQPQRMRHLTASAVRVGQRDSGYKRRQDMPWQRRALTYIDLIPELNYASRFYARMLKQLRIFPALRDSNEGIKPIRDGEPVALLDRIQDPGGGRSQILGNYGRLMFTTGEGVLFGRDLDSDDERWSFIWNDELKVDLDGDGSVRLFTHLPADSSEGQEYGPGEAAAYRMWFPHPRRSGEADSPMRAALGIAEELIILTDAVRATAVSRITNGILLMPSEISPAAAEPVGDEDPLNNPFIADLAAHFVSQVEDAGDAAASAPPLLEGAAEYLDRVRHLKLHDPASDYLERDLRKEAVERLARGFDFPPEVLLGLSESNHWAARQILDDMWRSHGAPIAEQFCDDLNDAYLRPALREAGYPDWKRVVIGYDESQVVVKPDRSDDADKAYDRGMISSSGYRTLKNIPEDFAPSEDEHDEWLAIKLRNPLLAGLAKPPAEEGPPPPGPEGDSGRQTRVVASARELGAAEMALARCRELAGIRIRQKEKQCPDCLARANGHPNALVAAKIGRGNLERLSLDPLGLVAGGADTLRGLLVSWGYRETQSDAIAEMVEVYAARTLLEPRQPQLPAGFSAHIERAKEASDDAH